MKILAAIIAHPLRKISGATNAGRELSIAAAEIVDMDLAVMWDRDETFTTGRLNVRHMQSRSRLDWAGSYVPRFMRIPLYDSAIPELVKNGRYDLVHIHNMVPTFAAERLAKACQCADVPYVLSTHGFYEVQRYASLNGFGPIKSALVNVSMTRPFLRTVKAASAILALSSCEIPSLVALGIPQSRIHVVTNGVNEYFLQTPDPNEVLAVKAKWNLGDVPLLFFMGSLHSYKGIDVFLRSLGKVKGEFQAVIAGSFKTEAEKAALLHRCNVSEAVQSRLVFTGAVSNTELRSLHHLADLFVYPTLGDTLPLVVLEAMACGTPVISTTVGGVPFAVTPQTGILVPPGDPHSVASAVNRLLHDNSLREAFGRNARDRVVEMFRWSKAAAAAAKAYGAVLEQPLVSQTVLGVH